ncbi:sterol desaturase/sphingolipid hydroxylase (fatty acid hydroxylase superfamily) [Sphingobium sp. OAS761]|uniref:sterol desaturase family protein n=1 Tax=Sphingobium sp. OAS761 TaxID=2817901 RepID=UPI00209EE40A|nr:sterol desaturase family protein [Sphingobium sp. OAS761]MCP1471744.1 sterol desaturase/sphingolipid hydroxylase (fatty acid hydroxylase superfamily) [Sphingobium sp. OAS761]
MDFWASMTAALQDILPAVIALPLMLIPFIVAEQIWPVGDRPGWRDYGLNILVAMSTLFLALPAGVAAAALSAALRQWLPWRPLAFTFSDIGALPWVGGVLEIAVMIFLPLLLHDMWFYWAHRIEHRVPVLWEFHKLHHSDERMNCSTWARDHFLQASWIAIFPAFTLGLIFDLDAVQAGQSALLATLFLSLWSMFYHSAIRISLPWLDRVLVTPQVHRIHHSRLAAHHDRNFADIFPLFDIMFGTYHRPRSDERLDTGLGDGEPSPRGLIGAQCVPAWRGLRRLGPRANKDAMRAS